jgi:hypothetical protein
LVLRAWMAALLAWAGFPTFLAAIERWGRGRRDVERFVVGNADAVVVLVSKPSMFRTTEGRWASS